MQAHSSNMHRLSGNTQFSENNQRCPSMDSNISLDPGVSEVYSSVTAVLCQRIVTLIEPSREEIFKTLQEMHEIKFVTDHSKKNVFCFGPARSIYDLERSLSDVTRQICSLATEITITSGHADMCSQTENNEYFQEFVKSGAERVNLHASRTDSPIDSLHPKPLKGNSELDNFADSDTSRRSLVVEAATSEPDIRTSEQNIEPLSSDFGVQCDIGTNDCYKVSRKARGIQCDIGKPRVTQSGRVIKDKFDRDSFLNFMDDEDDIDYEICDYNDVSSSDDGMNVPKSSKHGGLRKVLSQNDDELPSNQINDGDEVSEYQKKRGRKRMKEHLRIDKKTLEKNYAYKFFCEKCSFKAKRESHFNKHIKLHEKIKVIHRCRKCDFTSLRLVVLRKHEISAHSEEVKQCEKCDYKTDDARLLFKHERMKHSLRGVIKVEELTRSCPSCTFKTSDREMFLLHIRQHQDIDDALFRCLECPYKTPMKHHFERHIQSVHADHRPFLCDYCGRAFKRPDNLQSHMTTHIERSLRNYPHRCLICNKGFKIKAHVREHLSIHTNERKHLCHLCGAAFKTQAICKKHVQMTHSNPRAFQCAECEKRFNTKYALLRHQKVHIPANPKSDTAELRQHQEHDSSLPVFVQDILVPINPIDDGLYHEGTTQILLPSSGDNEVVGTHQVLTASVATGDSDITETHQIILPQSLTGNNTSQSMLVPTAAVEEFDGSHSLLISTSSGNEVSAPHQLLMSHDTSLYITDKLQVQQ